jgi:hypothetical protein
MSSAAPPIASLTDLQTVLQSQVDATKAIKVSAATLTAAQLNPREDFDAIVRAHLVLGAGDLTVGYTGEVPPATGDTLTLSGSATLLGVAAVPVTVTFTAPETGTADVQVAVELPAGWTLGSSFKALAFAPFDELALTDAHYVVTTMPHDTYTWNGSAQALVQGSQLLSLVTLNGPLAVAIALLEGGSTTDAVPLTGVVDPSKLTDLGAGLPAVKLSAPLGHGIAVPHFPLSAPRVELATGPDEQGGMLAWLSFATTLSVNDTPLCDFSALVASGAKAVTFGISPLDPPSKQSLTPATMIGLLGADYTSAIPEPLEKVFDAVALKGLSATVSLGGSIALQSVSASIGSSGPWGYGQFEIEETTLQVTAIAPLGTGPMIFSFEAKADLFPDVFKGEFDVEVQYDLSTKDMAVAAAFVGDVALSNVVSGLSGGTVTLPDDLEMTFSNFGAALNAPSQGPVEYTLYGTADAAVTLPFLGVHVDGQLQLLVDSAAKKYELIGGLVIGDSAFGVTVDLAGDDKTITGTWQALNKDYLGIDKLASAIGITAPPIPEGLDLNLDSATLSYDITNTILTLEASSATYGKAVLVALKSTSWSFFFGLEIDYVIGLSDIPIIGPELKKVVSVQVDEIQVLVSSPLDQAAATLIDGELTKLGGSYPQVPAAGMSGVALAMVFDAGGDKTTLTIAAPPPKSGPDPSEVQAAHTVLVPLTAEAPAPPPSPSDGTVWLTLQKSFGPIAFQKVGIRYRDSVLYFLMNASVSAGGLTIAVMGLGAGSPLTSFKPKFTIDGLAITYAEGPVELSGALVGSIEPQVDFYGELVLGVEQLQIAALGGYCEVDGHPSFFLYAVLDYPIGGPSFFFVTGLAAGFGFNRKLVIPPVDGVATFPLVQWAEGAGNPPPMDTDAIADAVTKVIGELSSSGVVAPSVGDYWLAVGVRFTSFELVNSFALLTVEFGTEFEIALLGMSSVQLPPAPAPPVALAQLELEAAFIPSQGLLSVSGQLTPQSFLLSPDCHLTGGFALVTWFSGDHEGQFVVTLGGYSPRFDKPSYYPTVPRLGLNWQVTPELAVSGDLYFALTSSAVMAGGGLSAVWQSGSIRAWFDVEADFLLVFEPFHYYITAGIHLGASFKIDLLFTSFTVSIHLGVDLEIWGPEFAGKATIDLSIISFTITFGSGTADTSTTIGWGEFVDKLLPSKSAGPAMSANGASRNGALLGAAAAGAADDTEPAVVQITVQAGLVKRLSDADDELNWVVNGEQLQLVTQSAIPTKDWTFSANVTLVPDAPATNTDFGVGPAGVSSKTFASTHAIDITSTEDCAFHADPVVRNVPAALWQTRQFDHGVPVGVDPLNSTTVDGVAVGFTITPFVTPPDHTLPIRIEDLEYTIADSIKGFAWTDAIAPETDPFDGQTVWGTIAAPGPAAVRMQLVDVIATEGWSVPTTIDVTELASRAAYDLIADPVLRLLGEQR